MKILHLIDSFDARFDRDQIKLVELLEKKGHNATIISSRYCSDKTSTEQSVFRIWEKRYLTTKILHMPSLKIRTPFSRNPIIVYLPSLQILYDYDVVHAYTFGTYSSLLGAASKMIKRSKVVIRSDLSLATYYKAKNNPLYRIMLTYPFKITDAVYTYTILEKRYLVDMGIQENKIWVIPVGIDHKKFSKVPITNENKRISIGYLGRFCSDKGVHRIIAPLRRVLHEKINPLVVFTGMIDDPNYANKVMAPLKKYRNFKYLGYVTAHNVLPFYKTCDIILIPSLLETGAITVLEAMASGLSLIHI